MDGKGTVERAFELARSGTCLSVDDVRRKLKSEQFESVDAHVNGSLAQQLKQVCAASVSAAKPAA